MLEPVDVAGVVVAGGGAVRVVVVVCVVVAGGVDGVVAVGVGVVTGGVVVECGAVVWGWRPVIGRPAGERTSQRPPNAVVFSPLICPGRVS
ncbi:MAG: hypothetical protein ACRDXE_03380, partial [Acidimicrobiales bacterium]